MGKDPLSFTICSWHMTSQVLRYLTLLLHTSARRYNLSPGMEVL